MKIDFLFFFNRLMDLIFAGDIVVNFNCAFMNSKGIMIDNPKQVHSHYLSTWFVLDFVSTIPWDLIAYVSEQQSSSLDANDKSKIKMVRLLKVVKLMKLIRVFKLVKTLGRSISSIKSTKQLLCKAYHSAEVHKSVGGCFEVLFSCTGLHPLVCLHLANHPRFFRL